MVVRLRARLVLRRRRHLAHDDAMKPVRLLTEPRTRKTERYRTAEAFARCECGCEWRGKYVDSAANVIQDHAARGHIVERGREKVWKTRKIKA